MLYNDFYRCRIFPFFGDNCKYCTLWPWPKFLGQRFETLISREREELSQKWNIWLSQTLIAAIEWQHRYCCSCDIDLYFQGLTVSCYALISYTDPQTSDVPGRFPSTWTASTVELLLFDLFLIVYTVGHTLMFTFKINCSQRPNLITWT